MAAFSYQVHDFVRPPVTELQALLRLQALWFDPQFYGLAHIDPARPALYVGNHTIYGGLDGPLMLAGLYEKAGVYLRALGDHVHFQVPLWRSLLVKYGTVAGTREHCDALMAAGEHILVYPGGGREVTKNRGEAYRLIWKERTGFAAMALRHGYDIIPFAAIGAEDCFDIHYDANDFRASRLGRFLSRRGLLQKQLRNGELFAPLVTGLAGLPLPRPEKLYFSFGPRISTRALQEQHADKAVQWSVRTQVEAAVYAEMDRLFAIRAQDAGWSWWRKRCIKR